MSGIETAAIISAVAAAGGAAASASAAQAQNRAIARSRRSANTAASIQAGQVIAAGKLEAQKNQQREQQVIGRIRVSSAGAGVGIGGSWQALEDQAQYESALNLNVIKENAKAKSAAISSGLEATIAQLEAGTANPILAGFAGGMQGLQAGLAIYSALPERPKKPRGEYEDLGEIGGGGANGLPSYGGSRFT